MKLLTIVSLLLAGVQTSNSSLRASVVMTDKLKNSPAGRIAQRRFEQYIGKRLQFRIWHDGKFHKFVGTLDRVIIPKIEELNAHDLRRPDVKTAIKEHRQLTLGSRGAPAPIEAVFSGVEGKTAADTDVIHALPASVPFDRITGISGQSGRFSRGARVAVDGEIFWGLTTSASHADGHVIATYCDGQYCEVLIEAIMIHGQRNGTTMSVIQLQEGDEAEKTVPILQDHILLPMPTMVMVHASELRSYVYQIASDK
ncbi:MAG: hypothetical protein OYH77_01425 [Pseudomonadota bacterium]|nr:hypothetical protein [Pseudomonadota bacterium]